MNAFCPIMSFQSMHSGGVYCLGKNCGFADAAGECLIKQALQCYVSRERTDAAEREERIAKYWSCSSSSGYPHTIEPSSNCITTSNPSHDDYWKGL